VITFHRSIRFASGLDGTNCTEDDDVFKLVTLTAPTRKINASW
jgi:hypothetical protein